MGRNSCTRPDVGGVALVDQEHRALCCLHQNLGITTALHHPDRKTSRRVSQRQTSGSCLLFSVISIKIQQDRETSSQKINFPHTKTDKNPQNKHCVLHLHHSKSWGAVFHYFSPWIWGIPTFKTLSYTLSRSKPHLELQIGSKPAPQGGRTSSSPSRLRSPGKTPSPEDRI